MPLYKLLAEGEKTEPLTWASDHVFPNGGWWDAVFSTSLIDNGGKASGPLTYSKLFGGIADKVGPGNFDALWASVAHHGAGEAGLFIGDVTAYGGGNAYGGDFLVASRTLDAALVGLQVQIDRGVAGGHLATGINLISVGTQAATVGVRIGGPGGWVDALTIRDVNDAPILNVPGSVLATNVISLYATGGTAFGTGTFKIKGTSDLPRVYGGGSAGGAFLFGSQGGAGTSGGWRFVDNDADVNVRCLIGTAAPTEALTVLQLAVMLGGVVYLRPVSVGASGSGGTGLRALTVAN